MTTATLSVQAHGHPIKSVTVFKSLKNAFGQANTAAQKAEVTRTFSVDLQAGQNEVNITGLSSRIDTRSVRVSGLGDNATLFDVMCTVSEEANIADADISQTVRSLQTKRTLLEEERSVRDREAELLMLYGRTLQGDHISPAQMTAFLDNFLERGQKNLEAKSELTERIADVDRQIQEEKKKAPSKVGQANGQVAVVISSEAGGRVDLTLTYIVSHATWEPIYDLFATTDKGAPAPSVGLHYRARICQSTGEDWADTKLVLSTATSDSISDGIPSLDTLSIKVVLDQYPKVAARQMVQQRAAPPPPPEGLFGQSVRPQQPQVQAFRSIRSTALNQFPTNQFQTYDHTVPRTATTDPAHEDEDEDEDEAELIDVPEPAPLSEPSTTVSASPFSMLYKVDRSATIPSDGKAHQVLIASLTFDACVSRIAVPRKKPVAYLKCRVKNTSDYRLLPGSVRVFLDEGYVSTTSIADVNAGDSFDCLLGVDTSIHLSYRRSSSTVKEARNAFSEQFKITSYFVETVIRNKHRSQISELIVRDAVPHASSLLAGLDGKVRIVLREPVALAEAKPGELTNVGDKGLKVRWVSKDHQVEGEYAWECKLDASEEIKLVVKYEVKAPVDIMWQESVVSS
ncbi:hypothetical protein NEOLEDRAFT_1179970 [Neolentinus lepideus HHB14362 ss-1]|uniref:Mucoidy inhibitor A n=1 Tax=Neolentinus lepideus HHB14362 ss-1 TaxID=1314782 RepID=A0A165RA40_9AGAM|nr:hypothetical protein NEOLEDRAFT_1179970 [Neolentinus lepideus HHB14362 ss-1]